MISAAKLHFFDRTSKKNHIFPTELFVKTYIFPTELLTESYTFPTELWLFYTKTAMLQSRRASPFKMI